MKYALGNMLNGAGLRRLDPDAATFIAATGATDTNAINKWVVGIKNLGIWNNIVCWPMRSTQNYGTGTALRSLGGLGQFNGTLTNGPSWSANGIVFDGVNDFIVVPNPQKSTAIPRFSIWSVFDSNITNGRLVFGSYNITSATVGPTLWAGASPLQGGLATSLHFDVTAGGSTVTIGTSYANANTGSMQTAFSGFNGGVEVGLSFNSAGRVAAARTTATVWSDNNDWRMGSRLANTSFFEGTQALNLYANIYFTPQQATDIRALYISTIGSGLGLP